MNRNGDGRPVDTDLRVAFGALGERVGSVEAGLAEMRSSFASLRQHFDNQMERLTETVFQRFDKLSAAWDRRAQTPWPALSLIAAVSIAIITGFGSLATLFVQTQIGGNAVRIDQEAQQRQQRDAEAASDRLRLAELLRDDYVPRVELDSRRADDLQRIEEMDQDIDQIRETFVARPEYSVQIAGLTDRLGRIEQTFNQTYSIGDVLKEIQDRLQKLEDSRATRAPGLP